jgi:SNW domain-containing protein 1
MAQPKQGERIGWTPTTDDDYGDGGAFPEIHVDQYPLGIGRIGDLVSSFIHICP